MNCLLLRSRSDFSLRHLGIAYLFLLALLVWGGKSRPDRIVGLYPLLLAGGGALLEASLRGRALGWLRLALPAALLLAGAALAPLCLPLLSPERAAAYAALLGVVPQIEAGEGKRSPLPQWLADRYGWERLVDDVEAVVRGSRPRTAARW